MRLKKEVKKIYDSEVYTIKNFIKHTTIDCVINELSYYSDTIASYQINKEDIKNILGDIIKDTGLNVKKIFNGKWDNTDPFSLEENNKNLLEWYGFKECDKNRDLVKNVFYFRELPKSTTIQRILDEERKKGINGKKYDIDILYSCIDFFINTNLKYKKGVVSNDISILEQYTCKNDIPTYNHIMDVVDEFIVHVIGEYEHRLHQIDSKIA